MKFSILFICILIMTASTQINRKFQGIEINRECFYHKLAMVNKFSVGNSKKLISCLKSVAALNKKGIIHF